MNFGQKCFSIFTIKKFSYFFLGFFFVLVFLLQACEPPAISELSAEDGIQRIRANHQEENFERVISDVAEYRSRYPYSQFAAEAELLEADSEFQQKKYPEAAVGYDDFLRRFPAHPQSDLALYRNALCYDLQTPEEVDREQANGVRAIEKYSAFLIKNPESKYTSSAKESLAKLKRRLAEHKQFVARFYWKKEYYEAALSRYLDLLENHKEQADMKQEALARLSESYLKLAKELEEKKDLDKNIYVRGETPESLRKKASEFTAVK